MFDFWFVFVFNFGFIDIAISICTYIEIYKKQNPPSVWFTVNQIHALQNVLSL